MGNLGKDRKNGGRKERICKSVIQTEARVRHFVMKRRLSITVQYAHQWTLPACFADTTPVLFNPFVLMASPPFGHHQQQQQYHNEGREYQHQDNIQFSELDT